MPINSTSPVATKALSVASKKLCLSPVAWPSIRANGSLAASSLLHHWSPNVNSMTWKSESREERPQCSASKQYSTLASILDVLPLTFSEPSPQNGECLAADVEVTVDSIAEGCAKSEVATGHRIRDDMQPSTLPTGNAWSKPGTSASQSEFSSQSTENGILLTDSPSSSEMEILAQSTDMQEQVAQQARLQSLSSGPSLQAPPHQSTTLSYTTMVGNPGIAMSLARHDYEAYVHRLERRCFDLFAENQQLRETAEKSKASHSRTQELNLRLGREVQQARRESVAATEHLRQYVEKADKAAARAKRRRATRHQSTQTVSCGTMDFVDNVSAMDSLQRGSNEESTVASLKSEECLDDSFICYPPGLESHEVVSSSMASMKDDVSDCRCAESERWGCSQHRSYGSMLLLAHRDLQRTIAHGPPGLELPRDKSTGANSADLGIYVTTVASLRKNRALKRGEAHV